MSVPLALLQSVLSEGLEGTCWNMQGRKSTGKKSNDTEWKMKASAIFRMWVMDGPPLVTAEQTGAEALFGSP